MDVDNGIGPSGHYKSPYDMHHDDYDRDGALRRLRTARKHFHHPRAFREDLPVTRKSRLKQLEVHFGQPNTLVSGLSDTFVLGK
jgi:hypothetical protein